MTFRAIQPFENLAVVGLSVAWAGCDSLDAFEQMIYAGGRTDASNERGKPGAPVTLMQVARQALLDAGIDPGASRPRVAVFAAGGPEDPAEWSWASSFTDLLAEANPLAAVIEQAQRLFRGGSVDAVLFAASSGSSGYGGDSPLAPVDRPALGFDRQAHGWRMGNGAGAVVLMPYQAWAEPRRIYALVRGMAGAPAITPEPPALPAPPSLDDVRGCCRSALEQAGVQPEQVGYIEAFASGVDALDGIEIAGLAQTYRQPVQNLTTALGSVQANTGYLGDAAGLAGLIRAALCLSRRMIPGAPDWSAPKLPALWRGAPFYVPGESRAWFEKSGGPGRIAGLDLVGRSGSFAHLILSEAPEKVARYDHDLALEQFYLIPLAAEDQASLLAALEDLRRSLVSGSPVAQLAARYAETAQSGQDAPYALAIVGHDADEAVREIDLASKSLPSAFAQRGEWQTPLGSYFTAEPVGRAGGVALVYPGAFNSYPGVGRDLFHLFPELFEHMGGVAADMGRVMHERLLYPRSLAAFSKDEAADAEARLLADPIAMLVSGTALGILYTCILRDVFRVQPQASFGYSLGENAMLFATGVWKQGDQASRRLEESDAFRVRLAGPQLAIREYWGMLPEQNGSRETPLWRNYLVMAPPEKVKAALAKESHVYMTHINTPRQVVIGGDPEALKRVLADLHGASLQAPFDYALHCEVMRSEYDELVNLHDWPVERVPDLRMYSAADDAPMTIERDEISHKIAQMLTLPLDFPRLIRKVYDDGARVFIEAGAGSNCARWIDETLKGSPHLSLSMNRRGTDDFSTLVRTLARLHSHRVPMDLSRLYVSECEKVRL